MKQNDKVSIILPTFDRYDTAIANVNNILNQDYPDFEIIVCDDSHVEYLKATRDLCAELKNLPKTKYNYVARFDHEGNKDYGLARARNVGVIEATGSMLIFLDDRITPVAPDFITIFVNKLKEANGDKIWFFGDKGAHKTSFVENCSAVMRHHVIHAGMFCERIDQYGGMTKEIVNRYTRQGFQFTYVPQALAKPLTKSKNQEKKEIEKVEMRIRLKRMGY